MKIQWPHIVVFNLLLLNELLSNYEILKCTKTLVDRQMIRNTRRLLDELEDLIKNTEEEMENVSR